MSAMTLDEAMMFLKSARADLARVTAERDHLKSELAQWQKDTGRLAIEISRRHRDEAARQSYKEEGR